MYTSVDTSGMKDYIGTKQIKAMPCTAAGAAEILNREVCTDNANEDGDGYLVRYKDGYTSWSPAAPFEEAYSKSGNFDFGMAIMLLKQGAYVARKDWNGKGMYLVMQAGATIPVGDARSGAALAIANEGFDKVEICPHIDMRSADGQCVVGWLASQTDMFAEDWRVVGGTSK